MRKSIVLWGMLFFLITGIRAEGEEKGDSLSFANRFIHQFHLEARPGHVFQTSPFLKGENWEMTPIRYTAAAHVKYSFQHKPNHLVDRIYGSVYQGIGAAYYNFGSKELGEPFMLYLFQGARLGNLTPRLSFNYEWNFGLSYNWNPYNLYDNSYNTIIGSKANAYLNANFYFNWMLSPRFDLNAGLSLTHFSNGNTEFPNAGLNLMGLKVGLVYNINRQHAPNLLSTDPVVIPEFQRHVSYDLVTFGSWRRKIFSQDGEAEILPDAFGVFGFNFTPMYNVCYRFRTGLSLDATYDRSANLYYKDFNDWDPDHTSYTGRVLTAPPFYKQAALGISARGEYVMPYFSINFGMGVNVLHAGGDLKTFYQVLALKVDITRYSFLHIGYSVNDFHDPNFLMLGIGFRLNNKYPKVW